jgi:hypothetical protein
MSWASDAQVRRRALARALRQVLDGPARDWLAEAARTVAADPAAVAQLFPAAGRAVGRRGLVCDPVEPWAWRRDEAARALLLAELPDDGRGEALRELYRYGDRDERSAVLRALDVLPDGSLTRELVADALRTNDPRLVAGALSRTGLAVLDEPQLVQAVLKCVFMGLELTGLRLPPERVTAQLARALAGYALERVTAGRTVPESLWPLVECHPPHDVLAALRRVHDRTDPAGGPAR